MNIFDKLKTETEFDKTFFLNCCLGLLITPQQWDGENLSINEEPTVEEWGIPSAYDGKNLTVEDIARHIRNSLSHFHFSVMKQDTEELKDIEITDYTNESRQVKTYSAKITFDNFQKFVIKYAEKKLEKLENA